MRTHALLLAASALLLLPPRLVVAQAPPAPAGTPAFGEQVEVTEVVLDAVVTDRGGNVIVGLGANDFRVTENGKPVPLTDVTFYSSRPRVDAAGHATTPAQGQRLFILFFHDQRNLNTDLPGVLARELDAARRAREWVGGLAAQDYVAVASWQTSLAIGQDFTRDRTLLQRAIDQAVTGKHPSGNWPSRMPPEGGPSLLRHLPKGNALRDSTPTIYEALETIGRAVKPIIGRKNLILFSGGFGRVNNFGQYVPDPRYDTKMIQQVNDANVAIYAIDLLSPNMDSPQSSALSNTASSTGGRYFQHIQNFDSPLSQILDETTGYYLLAYRSTHPRGASGYQPVEVTVKNAEFQVKARAGYIYGG